MTCPLRSFPMFNIVVAICHTMNALLPHLENTMNELKRKFQLDRPR